MNLSRKPVIVQTPSAASTTQAPTASPAADQFTQYFLNHNIRVAGTADDPLFMTADVAKYIADSHVLRVIHDYPAKHLVKTQHRDFPNQPAGVNFFTEKGLYYYLMKSRRPKAGEFQEWVLDLLTSLRRLYIDDLLLANKVDGALIRVLAKRFNTNQVNKLSADSFDTTNLIANSPYLYILEVEPTYYKYGISEHIHDRLKTHKRDINFLRVIHIYDCGTAAAMKAVEKQLGRLAGAERVTKYNKTEIICTNDIEIYLVVIPGLIADFGAALG